MYRPGLVFACLFVTAGWTGAASPNPDDLAISPEIQVKSRVLVRQLGNEDFVAREEAEEQLLKLGRLARPALNAGASTNPDPEIRFRCNQLLRRATDLDRKARLDTFLADTKGEYEHDLPAWKQFRAAVGIEWAFFGYTLRADRALDAAARRVFTDLVTSRANQRLMFAVDGSRVDLGDLVVWRRQDLYTLRYANEDGGEVREPTLEDVTALLFAESLVGSSYISGRRTSISTLMSGSGFYAAARGTDEKSKVYRAVAVAWLDSRNEAREMYTALSIATTLEMPEQACGLAARMLTTPAISPTWRTRGVSYLATNGTKKHIPLVDYAMTDAFPLYSIPRPVLNEGDPESAYTIQVRDLALAVALLLADQKLEDYGFADRYGGSSVSRQSYSYSRHYFPDDATRKTAFAKWEKWRKANPLE